MNLHRNVSRLETIAPKPVAGEATPARDEVAAIVASSPMLRLLHRGWRWLGDHGKLSVRGKARRLRVSETVSLGEKRFVSIVEVDGTSFLIGGGSASVALLTQLADGKAPAAFHQVIGDAWKERESA